MDLSLQPLCAAIVPIFDFINHSKNPNCDFKISKDGLELISLKEINPEDELYINYGNFTDTNLRSIQ